MEAAKQGIAELSNFFFNTLGLKSRLSDIGIDASHFSAMAKKACSGGVLNGYVPLNQQDIENIYKMCL